MLLAAESVLMIFLQVLAGYFICTRKWCKGEHSAVFSKISFYVLIPCLIFYQLVNLSPEVLKEAAVIIPAILIVSLVMFTLGYLAALFLRLPVNRRGVFASMLMTSNCAMVGIPVSTMLLGDNVTPYAMAVFAVQLFVLFTVGIYFIQKDAGQREKTGTLKTIRRIFLQPPLIAILVTVPLAFLKLDLPVVITDTARYLGNCASPISLIVAGIILYKMGKRGFVYEKGIIAVIIGRFVIAPLLVWGLGLLFGLPSLAIKVSMLVTGMPVMSNTLVVAESNGADSAYVTKAMAYSIFAMLIFIPVYQQLFQWI
ncbi:MAG: AEC family transporter [Christensenellales bacterium]